MKDKNGIPRLLQFNTEHGIEFGLLYDEQGFINVKNNKTNYQIPFGYIVIFIESDERICVGPDHYVKFKVSLMEEDDYCQMDYYNMVLKFHLHLPANPADRWVHVTLNTICRGERHGMGSSFYVPVLIPVLYHGSDEIPMEVLCEF